MKPVLLFIQYILFAALAMAQQAPEKINVKIKEGKFTINKFAVTPNWSVADGQANLGKAERIRPGYNVTHTYDQLGIVLFERAPDKKASGEISEIQFYTGQPDSTNIRPTGLFTGKIKIEKLSISNNLTYEALKKGLKKYTEKDSYIEHSHRLSYNGLYIYFQFDATETHLLKVSIGVDKLH
ncbi:MAG: hypothetical protein JST86_17660 [Bacteroidetes bacterium]|nr:hypothetical protein [Bacteroidota bacterium]